MAQLHFFFIQVLVELTRLKKIEETVLVFDVMHLGTEATVKTYNLAAVSYLKKISLDYYGIAGNKQWQRSGLCVCGITWSSLKWKCCCSFPAHVQLSIAVLVPLAELISSGLSP